MPIKSKNPGPWQNHRLPWVSKDEKISFTVDEVELLDRMINSVWQTIGGDILQCDEVSSLPQETVIETCLDASYLEMYGPYHRDKANCEELIKKFRQLSYEEQNRFCEEEALTYKTYA